MRIRSPASGHIRRLEPRDEARAGVVIRQVRLEFGVTGDGFDQNEPAATALHAIYRSPRSAYFVVDLAGTVEGGAGIGPYGGPDSNICELQRMYLAPAARGAGHGRALLEACLAAARDFGYRQCYLETAASLTAARALYLSAGFSEIPEPPGHAVHPSCDAYYLLTFHCAENCE
jgi:putative acetyltransferase